MSKWEDEAREGNIPPPPQVNQLNKRFLVVLTREDSVKEYKHVMDLNVSPGLIVLKFRDREVLVPITAKIVDVEISEEAVLL